MRDTCAPSPLYLNVSLGHFYLMKLLLPTLLSTAQANGDARVVNTSSSGHSMVDTIDFNTLKDGPARRKLSPTALYGQSKLVRPPEFFHVFRPITHLTGQYHLRERTRTALRRPRHCIHVA